MTTKEILQAILAEHATVRECTEQSYHGNGWTVEELAEQVAKLMVEIVEERNDFEELYCDADKEKLALQDKVESLDVKIMDLKEEFRDLDVSNESLMDELIDWRNGRLDAEGGL